MGIIAAAIKDKLTKSFSPSQLDVIDESHLHAHHAGAKAHLAHQGAKAGSGETHFHVILTAKAFAGMPRLARHRAVMEALSEELAGPVHALKVTAREG